MATAAKPASGGAEGKTGEQQPADVLVVFGITGDLAKVMTFHSLYRLEARGLLSCPIVGVAVDDWSAEDLRKRARESIEAAARPSTTRCSSASPRGCRTCRGDFADAGTFERVGGAIGERAARSSTWRSRPSSSAR